MSFVIHFGLRQFKIFVQVLTRLRLLQKSLHKGPMKKLDVLQARTLQLVLSTPSVRLSVKPWKGLDPAGPFAENCDAKVRIDQTDASFVDLIISNPGQLPNLGLELPVGHVNFYINDSEVGFQIDFRFQLSKTFSRNRRALTVVASIIEQLRFGNSGFD